MKREKKYMYALTPKQLKYAWIKCNPYNKLKKKEIAAKLGVQEITLYKWDRKPEFKKYVDDLFDRYAGDEEAHIWDAMIKRGKDPAGFQDRQLFFKLTGKLKDVDKIPITGSVNLILEE